MKLIGNIFSDIQFSELQDWAEGNVFSKKLRDNFDEKSEAYYFEQYSRRVVELIPVEGMEDIFKKLKLQDYKLVIVSSADEESIKNI
jgi:phosphoglycolate phosphatase-like HAD superfamily hydrolase